MAINLFLNNIGEFTTDLYWSSTERRANFAWTLIFFDGGHGYSNKNYQEGSVRAVKEFEM